jgi:hypothetical protein
MDNPKLLIQQPSRRRPEVALRKGNIPRTCLAWSWVMPELKVSSTVVQGSPLHYRNRALCCAPMAHGKERKTHGTAFAVRILPKRMAKGARRIFTR